MYAAQGYLWARWQVQAYVVDIHASRILRKGFASGLIFFHIRHNLVLLNSLPHYIDGPSSISLVLSLMTLMNVVPESRKSNYMIYTLPIKFLMEETEHEDPKTTMRDVNKEAFVTLADKITTSGRWVWVYGSCVVGVQEREDRESKRAVSFSRLKPQVESVYQMTHSYENSLQGIPIQEKWKKIVSSDTNYDPRFICIIQFREACEGCVRNRKIMRETKWFEKVRQENGYQRYDHTEYSLCKNTAKLPILNRPDVGT